jgi:hypothetical protein
VGHVRGRAAAACIDASDPVSVSSSVFMLALGFVRTAASRQSRQSSRRAEHRASLTPLATERARRPRQSSLVNVLPCSLSNAAHWRADGHQRNIAVVPASGRPLAGTIERHGTFVPFERAGVEIPDRTDTRRCIL